MEAGMPISNDSAAREAGQPSAPSYPKLKSIQARRVTYKTPRRFIAQGREQLVQDVIEIDVETTEEFPITGTGPALFVGSAVFMDSERIGERRYRFFGAATTPLKDGASIALGPAGSGVPKPEHRTGLRLRWSR
jgi:hypothetical protein